MTEEMIKVFGVGWCRDCHRAKNFFERNKIIYDYINIDKDLAGEQFVLKTNQGMRSVPTILFPDGSILVEPSESQLAQKLKLLSLS
jgi:glutaredoxin